MGSNTTFGYSPQAAPRPNQQANDAWWRERAFAAAQQNNAALEPVDISAQVTVTFDEPGERKALTAPDDQANPLDGTRLWDNS